MIYFLISFLFIYVGIASFFVLKKLEAINKKQSSSKVIYECGPSIIEFFDKKGGEINKELRTLLGNFRVEFENEIVKRVSNGYAKDYVGLVPNCVIVAKEKGYFKDKIQFEYNERIYQYEYIQQASENEIIISAKLVRPNPIIPSSDILWPKITIYKNGLWFDLKEVQENSDSKSVE